MKQQTAKTKVREKADARPERPSMRVLARKLGRSASHICRVMNGKRESASLARRLNAMGVEVEVA